LSDIWSLIGIKVMNRIIECVPNFSNGQNPEVYNAIAAEAETVEGVKLLNVDPGKATNRTVVTIAGSPEAVVEAAFRCIKKAAELIDMSKHKGEHPRMGATDVCPLVPISGITMEETAEFAKQLAKRVGEELHIPVYLYEAAQTDKKRSNLSVIREGEYEGFFEKIKKVEWKPDFGPAEFNAKAGATVIGARDFLIAYNVNLNTTSVRRANSVAFDIREKGRVKRIGDPVTGEVVKDENGNPVSIPGSLKHVKAIGWFIEEYGVAQISMNLTNIIETPLHIAFDETCTKSQARGLRVTGSEVVGLVPLNSLLDAGRYFLKKQQRSAGVSDAELIRIAVLSMGLDELGPFDPQKRVIEYLIAEGTDKLVGMSLRGFADETASESPAPGGGSIAAYCGAMGASLAAMVANLSSHKRGWDDKWEYFSDWAEKGQRIKDALLKAVDEDTAAFNKIMKAFELPKGTEAEKAARKQAVQDATKYAIEVPFKVMGLCLEAMEVAKAMADTGNPNSVTDAGVGALSARTGVRGAFLNVKINASGFADKAFVDEILAKGNAIEAKALALEEEVMAMVNSKISG
jgi:glutamate formiminotransferase/formiminotetrahydrofolate cyclodeaminase